MHGFEKAKFDLLKATLYTSDADIIGITELGSNEYEMPLNLRPSEIAKRWFEKGVATSAWNTDSISAYEPGGTMIITKDKSTAHSIKEKQTRNN